MRHMQEEVLRKAAADSLANQAALEHMVAQEEESKARAIATHSAARGPRIRWRSSARTVAPKAAAAAKGGADAAAAGPSQPPNDAPQRIEGSELTLVELHATAPPALYLPQSIAQSQQLQPGMLRDAQGILRPRTRTLRASGSAPSTTAGCAPRPSATQQRALSTTVRRWYGSTRTISFSGKPLARDSSVAQPAGPAGMTAAGAQPAPGVHERGQGGAQMPATSVQRSSSQQRSADAHEALCALGLPVPGSKRRRSHRVHSHGHSWGQSMFSRSAPSTPAGQLTTAQAILARGVHTAPPMRRWGSSQAGVAPHLQAEAVYPLHAGVPPQQQAGARMHPGNDLAPVHSHAAALQHARPDGTAHARADLNGHATAHWQRGASSQGHLGNEGNVQAHHVSQQQLAQLQRHDSAAYQQMVMQQQSQQPQQLQQHLTHLQQHYQRPHNQSLPQHQHQHQHHSYPPQPQQQPQSLQHRTPMHQLHLRPPQQQAMPGMRGPDVLHTPLQNGHIPGYAHAYPAHNDARCNSVPHAQSAASNPHAWSNGGMQPASGNHAPQQVSSLSHVHGDAGPRSGVGGQYAHA